MNANAWLGLVLWSVSALAWADYDAGREAYSRQHYASAIHEWRTAAEQGDADSQFALGRMFERGEGTGENLDEAHKWYRLAADNGLLGAQRRLGELYFTGAIEGDLSDAMGWFEQAAEQGSAPAQFQLGLIYLEGAGEQGEASPTLAARWFEQAAEQGFVAAQNNIGSLYENGRGVEQSYVRAFEWYERAAKQNDAFAQNNLGALYASGRGVEQHHAWAVFWFVLAAQNGNALAQDNIEASLAHLDERQVAATRVNVRAGSSTEFERVAQLSNDETVAVLGSMEGWSQIYFENEGEPALGWVSNTLIE